MAEGSGAARDEPGPLARLVARVGPIGCPALLVVGVVAAAWQSCGTRSAAHEATEAFLADLREGRARGAYERLTPARRAGTSFEAFDAETADPVLREGGEVVLDAEVTSWDSERQVCVPGSVARPDGEWGIEVHLVRGEDDAWRVHQWAWDPPRAMARLHLIDVCR